MLLRRLSRAVVLLSLVGGTERAAVIDVAPDESRFERRVANASLRSSIRTSKNIKVLGNLRISRKFNRADVWGTRRFAIVAKGSYGWGVVDTRRPRNPKEIAKLGLLAVNDVKVDGSLAVVTNQAGFVGAGAILYDLTDRSRPSELSRITHESSLSVHNAYLDNGVLYLSSYTTGNVEIFDVTDPSEPRHLASVSSSRGFIHDAIVENGRLYSSFFEGGFTVHDVTEPASPRLLLKRRYRGAVTHNSWPSSDGGFLFTTDETSGGHLRV